MMIYFLLVPGIEKPGTFCIEKINLIACWAKALEIRFQSQGLVLTLDVGFRKKDYG